MGSMKEYAFLLHDQCILAEGGHIEDPSLLANRIAVMLSRMLEAEKGPESTGL
jgi:HSP90 family molecular chaperone